jgi:chemotaxis protein MotB
VARAEAERLESLKAKIESVIEVNPLLKKYKNQMLLDITSEGLRIQIVDEQNRPMFALARAEVQPYTREILNVIGMVLNEVPNKIGLSGHTDSTPYVSDAGYSNWELSADRANASRRELVRGGLSDDKVLRVVGLAAAAHLDRADPFNPINRRISIIVMNKRTEEAVQRDNASIEVPAQQPAAAAEAALAAAGAPVKN